MSLNRTFIKISLFCLLTAFACQTARAEDPIRDIGHVASGTGKMITGAFSIPTEIIKGGVSSFPFGIITGAIKGTFKTVGYVVSGAFDVAKGAAPYAKYAAFV